MDWSEYTRLAERTANRGPSDTDERRLVNFSMGLAGEAGEVVDAVKKVVFHGHQIDVGKMRDELGDVLWYLAMTAQTIGLTLEEVAEANIEKLVRRYPEGFSSKRSIHRDGDLKQWVLAAEQSAVGEGVPNPVVEVQAAKRQGRVVTASVVLFDGQNGVLAITDGPIRSFQWLELQGGPFAWESGRWTRVASD